MNKVFILLFMFFIQKGFSQENEKWVKGTIFTKTDTINGLIKSRSISFDGIKFKKNKGDSAEYLTYEVIEGYKTQDYLYEKKFIKSFGTYGYYKFFKSLVSGKFNLYQTQVQSSNTRYDIYILNFDSHTITFKFYTFYKLKKKKKIAKELEGYTELQNIILEKRFNFDKFYKEIKNLNSK